MAIANALYVSRFTSRLTTLSLAGNSEIGGYLKGSILSNLPARDRLVFTPEGLVHIARALHANTVLTSIDLRGTMVGPEAGHAFARMLDTRPDILYQRENGEREESGRN